MPTSPWHSASTSTIKRKRLWWQSC